MSPKTEYLLCNITLDVSLLLSAGNVLVGMPYFQPAVFNTLLLVGFLGALVSFLLLFIRARPRLIESFAQIDTLSKDTHSHPIAGYYGRMFLGIDGAGVCFGISAISFVLMVLSRHGWANLYALVFLVGFLLGLACLPLLIISSIKYRIRLHANLAPASLPDKKEPVSEPVAPQINPSALPKEPEASGFTYCPNCGARISKRAPLCPCCRQDLALANPAPSPKQGE